LGTKVLALIVSLDSGEEMRVLFPGTQGSSRQWLGVSVRSFALCIHNQNPRGDPMERTQIAFPIRCDLPPLAGGNIFN